MKLYDAIMDHTEKTLAEAKMRRFPYDTARIWKDRGQSELIMLRDAAFELGGSGTPSVNYTCASTSDRVTEDEVFLYGPDLCEIKEDTAFARIVFLRTDDLGESTDEEKAFAAIRNLDFVRYHVYPVGYMVRVSSQSNREQVRVSKRVISAGISFAYVGAAYIRKFKEVDAVRNVRVIFVTDPDLVAALTENADKVDAITKTLTHILDGLPTDCGHCSMKAVCDEVEGMKELHLGKKAAAAARKQEKENESIPAS